VKTQTKKSVLFGLFVQTHRVQYALLMCGHQSNNQALLDNCPSYRKTE